jgi:hypothetical protein
MKIIFACAMLDHFPTTSFLGFFGIDTGSSKLKLSRWQKSKNR